MEHTPLSQEPIPHSPGPTLLRQGATLDSLLRRAVIPHSQEATHHSLEPTPLQPEVILHSPGASLQLLQQALGEEPRLEVTPLLALMACPTLAILECPERLNPRPQGWDTLLDQDSPWQDTLVHLHPTQTCPALEAHQHPCLGTPRPHHPTQCLAMEEEPCLWYHLSIKDSGEP